MSGIETNNVVERLGRTKTEYRTYGMFGCVGIQDETESREVPINPDGPAAIKLIQSLSDRIDELEGENSELGKQRLMILAAVYAEAPRFVATICDESLDRSGALLGQVRELSRASLTQGGK